MQATIDTNRKYYDEKMKKQEFKLDKLTEMVKKMVDQIKI